MQLVTRKATYSIHVTGGTTFSLYTVSYSYSPNIPIVVFSIGSARSGVGDLQMEN